MSISNCHLLLGFQVLIWVGLLMIRFFGFGGADIQKLKDWTSLITLTVIALSYTVGLMFARHAWTLLFPLSRALAEPDYVWTHRRGVLRNERPYIEAAQQGVPDLSYWSTYVKVHSPQVAADLEQSENRVKLAGATCVNVILIGAAGLVLAIHKVGWSSWQLLVLSTSIGIALVVLFFWTFQKELSQFQHNIRIAVIVMASP